MPKKRLTNNLPKLQKGNVALAFMTDLFNINIKYQIWSTDFHPHPSETRFIIILTVTGIFELYSNHRDEIFTRYPDELNTISGTYI